MKVSLALLALVAMAASANAAKLVVISINSGTGTAVPGTTPPILPAGAKGFLIGVANNTAQDVPSPLAFQDMNFSGPNLVQRVAVNSAVDPDPGDPDTEASIPGGLVNLRSVAVDKANILDDPDGPAPGGPATFGQNDSWWWDTIQSGFTLAPLSTGLGNTTLPKLPPVPPAVEGKYPESGLPGGAMVYTAGWNSSGDTPPGIWRMVYIVATGDVNISGILAAGPQGQHSFDLALGTDDPSKSSHSAVLRFSDGTIQPVPEPSTIVLAALGLVGLGVGAWRRRK